MTLQRTKDHLARLLADPDNRVIALTGKWGTGKSHLWREVKEASQDDGVRSALYVSLFGLSDINQLKLKIIQSALPQAEERNAAWERARIAVNAAKKVLSAVHKGFSALDDITLLATPIIMKKKVVAIDDIERKHANLSVDEVLGFIDEFTQQHESRFVLILNSDELANKLTWDTLREKVVDQEIRLSTSCSDAFAIAIGLTPSPYAERIKRAVETCRLTNIRIIRKVIKAVNSILGNRQNLADAVLARVIPSTVILSAVNYKGIEDGPDFEFVLTLGAREDWRSMQDKGKQLDDDGARKAKWKRLLDELDIYACDEYEVMVVEYLQSGLFDDRAVSAIIDRYIAESDVMSARAEADQFLEELMWDHRLIDEQLLERAEALVSSAHLHDPYLVSRLSKELSSVSGGSDVANKMVAKWIDEFRSKNLEEVQDRNLFSRWIDPRIKAEFDAIKAKAQANTTVFDACVHIINHSGWGSREELAMKSASPSDFEATIRNLGVSDLRMFMHKMLELCIQRHAYETHFGTAMVHFMEACRIISLDPHSARLGVLIRRLFDDSNLSFEEQPSDDIDQADV